MSKVAKKLSDFIENRKDVVIILTLICTFLSIYGLSFFKFNADTRVFFSKDDPLVKNQNRIDNQYSKARNIFLCLEARSSAPPTYLIPILVEWQVDVLSLSLCLGKIRDAQIDKIEM